MNMRTDKAPCLPKWSKTDISKLQMVFKSRATSYKFLFMKAFLVLLNRRSAHAEANGIAFDGVLRLTDIRNEMLANAWVPSRIFKLNLGKIDMVYEALAEIQQVFEANGYEPDYTAESVRIGLERYADKIEASCIKVNNLCNYVQYRFLTPWFSVELRGLPDGPKNRLIAEYSNTRFHNVRPVYKINVNDGEIVFHPDWLDYFDLNFGIVEGWLDRQWTLYLQNYNLLTPALPWKIWALQAERDTSKMSAYRKCWKPLLKKGFKCIYSNEDVVPQDYDLDHFMPWAWVNHDQLWNLVPTNSTTNIKKSSRIPHKDEHISKLADAHIRLLQHIRQQDSLPKGMSWNTVVEDYDKGLKVKIGHQYEDIDEDTIRAAYLANLRPQVKLALNGGFEEL